MFGTSSDAKGFAGFRGQILINSVENDKSRPERDMNEIFLTPERQTPARGRGLKTLREESRFAGVTDSVRNSTQVDIAVNTHALLTGKTLVSHGVEACPHVRKVLFRVQVAHFLPGRSSYETERRKTQADSLGDRSTQLLGARTGKGVEECLLD